MSLEFNPHRHTHRAGQSQHRDARNQQAAAEQAGTEQNASATEMRPSDDMNASMRALENAGRGLVLNNNNNDLSVFPQPFRAGIARLIQKYPDIRNTVGDCVSQFTENYNPSMMPASHAARASAVFRRAERYAAANPGARESIEQSVKDMTEGFEQMGDFPIYNA